MFQGQAMKSLIIFIIIIKCVYNFEVFISKPKDDNDQSIEDLITYNKSYQLPLFKTRYITIRAYPNDLLRDKYDSSNVIGFKFQVRSTNPQVISVEKQITIPSENEKNNKLNTILLEDLYILRRKKALEHILNAYPSPTLIDVNQRSKENVVINTTWLITGTTIDITNLTFRLDVFYDDDTSIPYTWSLGVLVTQPQRIIDKVFYIIMPFIFIAISILMGILLDTTVIASIFKKPTPVLIGFVAQYGLMPFLAMAIAKLFHYTPLNSLALFIIGCCPGSGASNQWTVLFDGDVNLSAVMSFVSTIASFVMMPIYFYTLGRLYMKDLKINVPFLGLARSLALVVVPYSIGIIISHFFPKSRPFVQKLIKPMMIFLMLFFLTFGMVVNWYLFMMIDLYTLLTAPLLPFLGFLFGGLLAWFSRMSWQHVKTIGIEAGIQNVGIAFMIIMYSFPPSATQAIIVPMVVAFLTTKPFWVILIIRNQIRKYKKRKELKQKSNIDETLVLANDIPPFSTETNHKDDYNETNHKQNHKEDMQQL